MFRYSRNNRIGQDALGHHSFSDSTGIVYYRLTKLYQIGTSKEFNAPFGPMNFFCKGTPRCREFSASPGNGLR